jgi:hypothetical protein
VGVLADRTYGAIRNIGDSVTLLMLFALPALWLLWRLPETRGLDLDSLEDEPGAVT